jgi:aminoglycoside phosphotransferase (APT) family kinase protein
MLAGQPGDVTNAFEAGELASVAQHELIEPVLDVLARERPDIVEPPIELIDMGFSSFVLSTGSGYVIRVARTGEAADGHAREYELLPRLAPELSVAVPAPRWRLEAGPVARFGAMAYPRIDGSPLPRDVACPKEVVDQLADFLVQVHGIGDPAVRSAVVPLDRWTTRAVATVSMAVNLLSRDLSAAEHRRMVRWRDEFTRHVGGLTYADTVVVHGDFWHDNVLVDAERLVVGVVDWEAASIADPAVDLAPAWDIDPQLGAELMAAYQDRTSNDPSLPERVRLLRVARNVGGISWSVANDDAEEYADSLTKVRDVLSLV